MIKKYIVHTLKNTKLNNNQNKTKHAKKNKVHKTQCKSDAPTSEKYLPSNARGTLSCIANKFAVHAPGAGSVML